MAESGELGPLGPGKPDMLAEVRSTEKAADHSQCFRSAVTSGPMPHAADLAPKEPEMQQGLGNGVVLVLCVCV